MENEATLQTQVEELQAQLDQADEGLPDSSPQDDDNNNADMIAEMQQVRILIFAFASTTTTRQSPAINATPLPDSLSLVTVEGSAKRQDDRE